MKNIIISHKFEDDKIYHQELSGKENNIHPRIVPTDKTQSLKKGGTSDQDEILFITSFPPRECGIATYSQDLIKALNNQFSNSFAIKVCALETGNANYSYPDIVKFVLNTSLDAEYNKLALKINKDKRIKIVLIQHEFGLFHGQEQQLQQLLDELVKPVVVVFHTVLPEPNAALKSVVQRITDTCESVVVMTHTSSALLVNYYAVPEQKISVIAHGTHLVAHLNKHSLKLKYGLKGRKVLTTFGLLGAGKSVETTIDALPSIVEQCPEVVFLVIGKTHPEVVKSDGEQYREMLVQKVKDNDLQDHVMFINRYLDLPELLEYLQLTDIYLFTTKDPNQAVSGTFVYAMSCACPIISTPIPHAKEVLTKDTGIIFDFGNSRQLADAVNRLLSNDRLRRNMSIHTLQKIVLTSWENSAIAHAVLFEKIAGKKITLQYNLPEINLNHLKHMTTHTGIIQFSKVNQPDIDTGYTLDDNARAMVASGMHFELTGDKKSVADIKKYLSFIKFCQQPSGDFLNYVDRNLLFTDQNATVNLDDSNGRAIWALGYLVSLTGLLPEQVTSEANAIIEKSLHCLEKVHSARSMAFALKGLYYTYGTNKSPDNLRLIKTFANRLARMYNQEAVKEWEWFEDSLTYANSTLPEAMLCAWLITGEDSYKEIAITSLDFLLSKTFNENGIEVISNQNWLKKGAELVHFGEQPIDVAYTIMTLSKFYDALKDESYRLKMETAFSWFLGSNRLHQIIYNPCTGGCYDGLEKTHVNLNQGAESTVSYLMARFTIEKYKNTDNSLKTQLQQPGRVPAKQRKPLYATEYNKYPAQPLSNQLPFNA